MVRRSLRTRARKRVSIRTPGSLEVTHFKKKKPGKPSCGRCGKKLAGMPNRPVAEIRALKRSERVPSRPYAGVLCTQCLEDLVRYVTRLEVKHSNPDYRNLGVQRDLTIERFLPKDWHSEVSSGRRRLEKVIKRVGKKEEKPKGEALEKKPAEKKKEKKANKSK
ncbi:MAG: hypothetical protein V1703_01950 [Candidatus Altiarchaeota archaeon]